MCMMQVVEDTQDNTISGDSEVLFEGKPIADLFTETTVIFADIAGFTAWSSVREPSQVFTLLETIYRAFDEKPLKIRKSGASCLSIGGSLKNTCK